MRQCLSHRTNLVTLPSFPKQFDPHHEIKGIIIIYMYHLYSKNSLKSRRMCIFLFLVLIKSIRLLFVVIVFFLIYWFSFAFQWTGLVRAFRNDIQLSRHRRYMKTYDDCFVASDAVEWVHQYLQKNPNFGTDVTRYF